MSAENKGRRTCFTKEVEVASQDLHKVAVKVQKTDWPLSKMNRRRLSNLHAHDARKNLALRHKDLELINLLNCEPLH